LISIPSGLEELHIALLVPWLHQHETSEHRGLSPSADAGSGRPRAHADTCSRQYDRVPISADHGGVVGPGVSAPLGPVPRSRRAVRLSRRGRWRGRDPAGATRAAHRPTWWYSAAGRRPDAHSSARPPSPRSGSHSEATGHAGARTHPATSPAAGVEGRSCHPRRRSGADWCTDKRPPTKTKAFRAVSGCDLLM